MKINNQVFVFNKIQKIEQNLRKEIEVLDLISQFHDSYFKMNRKTYNYYIDEEVIKMIKDKDLQDNTKQLLLDSIIKKQKFSFDEIQYDFNKLLLEVLKEPLCSHSAE